MAEQNRNQEPWNLGVFPPSSSLFQIMIVPNHSKIIHPEKQTTTHLSRHDYFKIPTFFLSVELCVRRSCYPTSIKRIHWDVIAYKWFKVFCGGKKRIFNLCVMLIQWKQTKSQGNSKYTVTDYFLQLFSKHNMQLLTWMLITAFNTFC